jgi:Dolichyl-phosphate-mannose-protein mannosyltransferase
MAKPDGKLRPRMPVSAAFLTIASAALVLAIYLLRLDHIAGNMVDDAWYVMLARALARGEGYRLVNAPTPGILPSYPPGFPAILSLVFLLRPRFPENVLLLKAVSIVAMMTLGVVSHQYFLRYRKVPQQLALALAVAVVITPAFVFLATSTVMSECVFTLVQLLAIILVDRGVAAARPGRDTLLAGVLAAATVMIRTAGACMLVAAMLYLLKCRRWRHASLFAITVLLCLAPWWWYARTHAPALQERVADEGAQSFTYGQQFWMRWAGESTHGMITVRDLPARVKDGLVDVFGRDVAGIVVPTLFRGASESGEEVISVGGGIFPASMGIARGTVLVSYLFSAVALLGFVSTIRRGASTAELMVPLSIGMIVLWPWWAYRFVLPLTPYLFFYLLAGLRTMTTALPVARVAVLCVIGLNVADHARYIARSRTEVLDWAGDAQEIDALLDWMRQHVTDDGYVAATNAPLVHLRTGRQTVAIDDPAANWQRWKSMGVRYLVCLVPGQQPPADGPYRELYRSRRHGLWIIEI